ncbi:MAG: hypothetical protein MUE30_01855 [Spirosomaceae bacterium]|jgi:hypothetical protein|nr:hypothetical protein [Spirosomataceae bacterium]
MLNLLEVSEMRVKLKGLETQVSSGELSLFERCEIEDAILELKEHLGQFDRAKWDDSGECINCSG